MSLRAPLKKRISKDNCCCSSESSRGPSRAVCVCRRDALEERERNRRSKMCVIQRVLFDFIRNENNFFLLRSVQYLSHGDWAAHSAAMTMTMSLLTDEALKFRFGLICDRPYQTHHITYKVFAINQFDCERELSKRGQRDARLVEQQRGNSKPN